MTPDPEARPTTPPADLVRRFEADMEGIHVPFAVAIHAIPAEPIQSGTTKYSAGVQLGSARP
jgi:hypothetical protein